MKLIYAATYIVLALMMTLVILELIVGCGDVTYLSDQTWRVNECLFIPSR